MKRPPTAHRVTVFELDDLQPRIRPDRSNVFVTGTESTDLDGWADRVVEGRAGPEELRGHVRAHLPRVAGHYYPRPTTSGRDRLKRTIQDKLIRPSHRVLRDQVIVCTWNPTLADDLPDGMHQQAVDATRAGVVRRLDWSIGNHRHGIGPGSTAYLLRQGDDRGIVARGTVVSLPFEDAHWDGSGQSARYVTIDWDVFLPDDDVLGVDVLVDELPDGNWNQRYQSGGSLDGAAATETEQLFTRHLRHIGWPTTDE